MGFGKLLCVAGLLGLAIAAHASSSVEYFGATFTIAEEDAIVQIQNNLKKQEASGALAKKQQMLIDRNTNKAQYIEPVSGLIRATKDSIHYIDPTFTLDENIYDHEGNIVAMAGAKVNPLSVMPIKERMFFFDGDDPSQVEMAITLSSDFKNGLFFMPILVKGKWRDLSKQLKRAVYFDQKGVLSRKFEITAVPALVSQFDEKMKVEVLNPELWLAKQKKE